MSASSSAVLTRDATGSRTADLSFSSGVSRCLVHRRALSEVLLTDWCSDDVESGAYRIAAQWSRSHSLYRVHGRRHDPLLLAETLRQSGILLCHTGLGVPEGHRMVMDRMMWHTPDAGIHAGLAPVDVTGAVRLTEIRRRTPSVATVRIDIDFMTDDGPAGSATGIARCVSPQVYTRLRGAAADSGVAVADDAAVDHSEVGVLQDDDVVLGRQVAEDEWRLRVLAEHAVFFDHPLDHVPGMVLIEGMRQAGRLQCGWPSAHVADCDVQFTRFVELGAPSSVHATLRSVRDGAATLEVEALQDGKTAAAGFVVMRATGALAQLPRAA